MHVVWFSFFRLLWEERFIMIENDKRLPPNTWFVGWFDFIVQMIQYNIVDEFVPCQNGSDFTKTSFANLQSNRNLIDHLIFSMNRNIFYMLVNVLYLKTSCWIWNVSLDLKTFVPPPVGVPSFPVSLEYNCEKTMLYKGF